MVRLLLLLLLGVTVRAGVIDLVDLGKPYQATPNQYSAKLIFLLASKTFCRNNLCYLYYTAQRFSILLESAGMETTVFTVYSICLN